jgi:hypothetical protein
MEHLAPTRIQSLDRPALASCCTDCTVVAHVHVMWRQERIIVTLLDMIPKFFAQTTEKKIRR